ncbi:MAG TPA: hypothetical protein VKT53_00910 [Candidatus Acidoferrum sp.]|nr:hypothetical protein [Candidatus Acidoferrum sp.]
MKKRIFLYAALVLGIAVAIPAFLRFENWRIRRATLRELEPFLSDEQEQTKQMAALGNIDLNPSTLTLATLEQQLKTPARKLAGDFNTTRLGWVCGKERCAIWASFLTPSNQDILPDARPAGLVISSPVLGEFPNVAVGEIHLGQSDQKLQQLSRGNASKPGKSFHRVAWDKDWDLAWGGVDDKVSMLVFTNEARLKNFPPKS